MKNNKVYLLLIILMPVLNFAQGSGSSVSFDGVNDYADIGTVANGVYSIEFWFSPNITYNSTNMTEPASLIVRNTNPFPVVGELQFFIAPSAWTGAGNDGKLAFSRYIGTNLHQIVSDSNEWIAGTWYHIAGVIDPVNGMALYVNGIKQTETDSSTSPIDTRAEITTFGKWGDLNIRFFNGSIDEVRIWNTTLSELDIRSNMTKKITNSHPNYANLVAYYNFDSGSGSTLFDQTPNGNDGSLVNSPLWQTSSAPIGDYMVYTSNVSAGSSLNLSNSDGSNFKVNVTSGTSDLIYIYNIDEEPNITTPPIGLELLSQTNYWGVKAFGNSSLVYEVVYNYDGHAGISNEDDLRLCSRSDNSTPSWVQVAAILDTGGNTLTLGGGQTRTEFILGSVGSNTLPIDGFELQEYSFYPNPTSDFLKLSESNFNENQYQIFDMKGKKLLEGEVNDEKEIDVRGLSQGIYFLRFYNSEPFKFIKR